jgi:CDP-diacylglycerol--glycerol-3-phosphate 3-phosphatidyltransferase
MTDLWISYTTWVLWTIVAVGYGVRSSRFGAFDSDRVRSVGGTILVGENVMRATYWAIDPVVRALVFVGATPNFVTWSALVLGVGAGAAIMCNAFGLAFLLASTSTICDILDGQVARVTGTGSMRGELLDAAVDRYTEFALIAGFVVLVRDSPIQLVTALAAMLASFMISFASAKAEALAVAVPRGLMRRHERGIFLIMGVGLTPLLGPMIHNLCPLLPIASPVVAALVLVGTVGNHAAIVRLVRVSRGLAVQPIRPPAIR